MNKRLKFFISIILIFALFVSCFCIPASSFENSVETSTADMLLVNVDTDTVVFSQKPDNMWYAGTFSELVTFLLAYETIEDPEEVTFEVTQSFISGLPYSDGCLDKFVGKTLTAKDLMAIMLMTSGSDAAYALAGLASDNNLDLFLVNMNNRVKDLGCQRTGFVSPGFNNTSDHYTTCRDLYHIYMAVKKIGLYQELMEPETYTPAGLDEKDFSVGVEPSILNSNSPYYFRYVIDAQHYYTSATYGGIALTTTYRGKTYFYAGLLGLDESERNVYADARKLTTWAYLNLSDRKMFNAEDALSSVKVKTDWGEYDIDLHPYNSAFKTLPNEYDESKLAYSFDLPESVRTPILSNQSIGSAKITYDGEEIDDVPLTIVSNEGMFMLQDFGRFSSYVLTRLMPNEPVSEEEGASQSADETGEPQTDASTDAAEETAAGAAETAATEG